MYNNLNQSHYPYNESRNSVLDPRGYNIAPTQNWAPAQPVISGLKGRPVSSLEEARAAQIDLDGSVHIFPDLANKKIYTKTINVDGTASFNVFALDESGQAVAEASYVTHAELEDAIKKVIAGLNQGVSSKEPAVAAPKLFNI